MNLPQSAPSAGALIAVSACLVLGAISTAVAESPYSGLEGRRIKALSAEQIEGYESGRGMGRALTAELNGFPGPRHVLDLADDLELSVDQQRETEEVFTAMRSTAIDLGREIVRREEELDRLFRGHAIDAADLETRAAEIGTLEGRLRAVHLRAHLEMIEILTEEQVRRYLHLRGYHDGSRAMEHLSGGHQGDH